MMDDFQIRRPIPLTGGFYVLYKFTTEVDGHPETKTYVVPWEVPVYDEADARSKCVEVTAVKHPRTKK